MSFIFIRYSDQFVESRDAKEVRKNAFVNCMVRESPDLESSNFLYFLSFLKSFLESFLEIAWSENSKVMIIHRLVKKKILELAAD